MNLIPLLLLTVLADVQYIGRPDTAVHLALKDCTAVLEADPLAKPWYVWVRDSNDSELIDTYDYILNTTLSRADYPLRTVKINGGTSGTLLRLDLRNWLPEVQHQFNFLRIIQGYQDPSFYVQDGVHKVLIQCDPFVRNGNTHNSVNFNLPNIVFSPAVMAMAGDEALQLCELTGLQVPIVEAERWMVDSLRVLQGGLYYKLQGVDTYVGNTPKRLTQKEWLATFGADEEESDKLNGEEYSGMWRSGVTAKPRRGKFLYGRATRPSVGPPLIVITQDGADEDLDPTQHPIYSLFDFEYAATEILATRPNGTIAYALFAADGTLQDSAPDNVVTDHEVPRPHTQRLEPAIACIRCHANDSQWKPMPNQVRELLSQSVNVVTDFSLDSEEVYHELRSLYSGDLSGPLKLARTAHEFATIKMVDFKLEGDGYAVEAAKRVSLRFNRYTYDPIDAQEALRTLGIKTTPEKAVGVLDRLLPTDGLIDPAVASLKLDILINRTDWERIYPAVLGTALTHGEIYEEPAN